MTETLEQIMARRMIDKDPSTFDALPEIHKLCLIQSAKDQIAALKEAGMVIVPVEPTLAMSVAMVDAHANPRWSYESIYRAAIKQGEQ